MSQSITKGQIVANLEAIQELYEKFLSSDPCNGTGSQEVIDGVNAIIEEDKDKEKNGGNYSTRIVIVVPEKCQPIIVLNLLYRAAKPGVYPIEWADDQYYAVSISFVPHPNGKQSLVLAPTTETLYKDGRIVGGFDLCDSITAYDDSDHQQEGEVTECLIICGDAKKCEPNDCLDFLSYLCKTLGLNFSVRRDKCGKLWLISNEWTNQDFPFDHKVCTGEGSAEVCTYYVNYDRLRCYYEKKSCFRFDDCDPAQLSQTTRCYEIYFACMGEGCDEKELVAVYAVKEGSYERLPRCYREIAEACNFVCSRNWEITPPVLRPSGEGFENICVGNYTCTRRLYCCNKDKCSKYRTYHQCCRRHAHEHHHANRCNRDTECGCGFTKKFSDCNIDYGIHSENGNE